jgi:hypothetical protein
VLVYAGVDPVNGEELGGQNGSHSGQTADEGRVRVVGEQLVLPLVRRGRVAAAHVAVGGQHARLPPVQSIRFAVARLRVRRC